jgi:probable rRNA maturation factor
MLIDIEIDDERWLVAHKRIQSHLQHALGLVLTQECADPDGDLVILLCDDQTMRELNTEYRQKDKATNVLAFPCAPMPMPGGGRHYGDIALGYETCMREAKEQNKTIESHLTHLAIHGVLHLLGYDHIEEGDSIIMEAREKRYLKELGFSDPYFIADITETKGKMAKDNE